MWLFGVACLACVIIANVIYNRVFHPLARVPGPILASITPLWLVWQCMHNRRPMLDIGLHKKYGSVIRITPNEIIFSNPQYFKAVYGALSTRKWVRSRFLTDHNQDKDNYDRLNLLTEVDMDKLRVQRRFIGPIYSTANAKKHEQLIDNNIKRWDARLKGFKGSVLDFYPELELLGVDVMSELTFGEPFGAVEQGDDGGHMESMSTRWSWIGWVGFLPWFCNFYNRMMLWNVPFTRFRLPFPVFTWAVEKMAKYKPPIAKAEKKVPSGDAESVKTKADVTAGWTQRASIVDTSSSKRMNSEDKKCPDDNQSRPSIPAKAVNDPEESTACLYDDLQRLKTTKPEFRPQWVAGIATTNIQAGIDTTSWTLATVIASVCGNPSVYQKLRAELDEAVASGSIARDLPPPYEKTVALPYLQACMRETMRMFPNIAVSLGRIVPAEGISIDGYFIPAGSVVGMNSKQLGLSEEVFGAHTERFEPERWLAASKERFSDMENRNLAFGGPSRKCPGMNIAWVALTKILAFMFLNFDVKVLNELNGPAGPGGRRWIELGSFPTKWEGMEAVIEPR